MEKSSARGRRNARVLLRASTALASVSVLIQAAPSVAQNVIPPQSGTGHFIISTTPADQPKAGNGPSSCSNSDPFEYCIGDDHQTGSNGAQGTQAGSPNYAFAPGVDIQADTGNIAAAVVANGGKGGDGGDGGALSGGVGYANGGNAGDGGAGGNATFGQRGDGGVSTSKIVGAEMSVVLVEASGGTGGNGGVTDNGNISGYGKSGKGGAGGSGSTVTFTQDGYAYITSNQPGVTAVRLESNGGNGGNSPDARSHTSHATANDGGNGGEGGEINATISGSIVSKGSGVVATSAGGNGGYGGMAQTDGVEGATGGKGGDGGGGNSINLTVAGGSISSTGASGPATGATQTASGGTITFSAPTAALQASIIGGRGGAGNGADGGFSKGVGGNGGGVEANFSGIVYNEGGTIATTGYAAAGMVVQNIGGNGGNGGYGGGVFVAKGGSGATGGDASGATAKTAGGTVSTTGDASPAMLAQSVGGGGGFGAGASVSTAVVGISLGGNGADGGAAGGVTIYNGTPNNDFSQYTNGSTVFTKGYGSHALVAQSVGGGGGVGGDATTFAAGILAVAIGGTAGSGGAGDLVTVQNGGVVQTDGDDSYGLLGQSVGGGGGDGGAAYSLNVGAQLTVATAVGGNGGTGGAGKTVNIGNQGQVVTSGANSFGMVAQSIGGGGGTGGSSYAHIIQVYNDPEYPSLVLNVSLGGKGGSGNVGGNVSVGNEGAVLTSGPMAYGILAQSVGGGGGAGGDANSLNQSYRSSSLNITTTIGGNGGKGGDAGTVYVENSGFINTAGDEASAVYAQSVGGGGGTGGNGFADTGSYQDNDTSLEFTLSLGGGGGAAGNGNLVTVKNDVTGIATYGNKANGIFAQSVGGGGGNAGGAVSNGGGGTVTLNLAVGGSGGGGGTGGDINVTNEAAIYTRGGDSAAIYAQSVGGGGGNGGSATVGDGNSPQKTLESFIANGMGIGENVVDKGNGIYELANKGKDEYDDINKLAALDTYFEANNESKDVPDGDAAEGSKITVNIGGGVAGTGATAGNGGTLTLTNNGTILTKGAASEGIFAQSVGGGGGVGGGATSANGKATIAGSFGIGGNSGVAGSGGTITATNTGAITTNGDLSHAIFAQSVGGGGGKGGMSAGEAAAYTLVTVNLGGNGGSNGDGGAIAVTNSGVIATGGDDAIGVVAQSLGGGGGVAGVLTENDATSQSETGNVPDTTLIPITLSGNFGNSALVPSKGQKVDVELTGGSIITQGRDSYGVLAQSIGGGGGLVLGVNGEADQTFFGSNQSAGAGGEVDVNLTNGTHIETHGNGAAGILAQSIGGGGGLVGGLSAVDLSTGPRTTLEGFLQHAGQGGNVNIDVEPGTRIDTYGTRAHGIFVQAVGAGGGVFGIQGGAGYTMAGRGACLSAPCSGAVTINADGFVLTHGPDSWGIYAQAQGDGTSGVTINLLKGTGIVAGSAGGIYIDSKFGTNTVNNIGYISGSNGVAISTNGAGTLNSGVPSGGIVSISGNILSSGAGWNITNNTSSRLYTNTLIQSNAFANHGEIWLGSLGANNVTEVTSALNSSDGRIVAGVDFAAGKADVLKVDGTATIGGQILINPINLQAGSATIVQATGFTLNNPVASNFTHETNDSLTPKAPYLYTYQVQQTSATTLNVTAQATLAKAAATFKDNDSNVAGHLQDLFEGGTAAGQGTLIRTLLTQVDTPEKYARTLDSLGAHTLGVAAASRGVADRVFTTALMDCPVFAGGSARLVEDDCAWARAGGGRMDTRTNATSTGFDSTSYTLQIGGQKAISDGWLVGGSLAYEHSKSDGDTGLATIKGDSVLAGVTLKRQSGPLILTGAVTGGLGWFDSERRILVGDQTSIAKASPKTQHAGVHVKASYDIATAKLYLRPELAIDATYVHFGAFTERNSPFALDVAHNNDVIFSATPALEVGAKLQTGSVTARPYLRGGAAFYDKRNWTTSARLIGTSDSLDRFESATAFPKTAAQIGAGLNLISSHGFELKLEYAGELGKDYRSHRGFVRLGYHF